MNFFEFLKQRRIGKMEFFLLLIPMLAFYCNNLLSIDFQPDETYWIVTSVRLDNFIKGDFSAKIWDESFDTYEVRPMPSYLAAIGQRLSGLGAGELPVKYWDWSASAEDNILSGAMPNNETLISSRLPMAIAAGISLMILVGLIAAHYSRVAAYIFFLSSFNDYFMVNFRRVLSEPSLLLFTVLAIAATNQLLVEIKNKNMRSILAWSFFVGCLSGLAGQSKLTGLACGVAAIISAMLFLYRKKFVLHHKNTRIFLTVAIVISAATIATFVLSYPFLYQETFQRVNGTFLARRAVLAAQLKDYPTQVVQPKDRAAVLLRRVFSYPIHIPPRENQSNLAFSLLNLGVSSFGVYSVIRRSRIDESNFHLDLLVSAIFLGVPMMFLALDWIRYYMYPVLFACIFFSVGLAQIILSSVQFILLKYHPFHA